MNYRDFKMAVVNDNYDHVKDYEQIVFRTPDGVGYHNVKVDFTEWSNTNHKVILVDLFNIKPRFKVGDVVCNNGGLHSNVKCTIVEVNEELQYYGYKEVNGKTYFKDQDKLKLVEIEPKFKIGDKVKGVSSEFPEREFVINNINFEQKCYHYFNGKGIITLFKDQDKLILVKADNSTHPVKDKPKFAIDAAIARNNTQRYNYSNFDAIEYLENLISSVSKAGGNSCTTTQYMELVEIIDNEEKYDVGEETKRILWHFRSLGFIVKTEDDVENKTIKITISW